MTKPPHSMTTASITNSSVAEESVVDAREANLSWGTDLSSTYELLRREGEIHEGRVSAIDELRQNMARLEDLHGQLHFLMREVGSILRR